MYHKGLGLEKIVLGLIIIGSLVFADLPSIKGQRLSEQEALIKKKEGYYIYKTTDDWTSWLAFTEEEKKELVVNTPDLSEEKTILEEINETKRKVIESFIKGKSLYCNSKHYRLIINNKHWELKKDSSIFYYKEKFFFVGECLN